MPQCFCIAQSEALKFFEKQTGFLYANVDNKLIKIAFKRYVVNMGRQSTVMTGDQWINRPKDAFAYRTAVKINANDLFLQSSHCETPVSVTRKSPVDPEKHKSKSISNFKNCSYFGP